MDHCYCSKIPPLKPEEHLLQVENIFVLMHHKEIGLSVDTAKLIWAAFPNQTQVVVGGLGTQPSLQEMQESIQRNEAVVLFPGDPLVVPTIQHMLQAESLNRTSAAEDDSNIVTPSTSSNEPCKKIPFRSLILIDGTWVQARRLYAKHIAAVQEKESGRVVVPQVQLNPITELASDGRQARPHPLDVREISTAHALELFLRESKWASPTAIETLRQYQVENHRALERQKKNPWGTASP